MKLTVRTRKLIAFFLVVSMIIPLMSSFDVWDQFDDSVYASGITDTKAGGISADEDASEVSDRDILVSGKDSYVFNMSPDMEIYNYDAEFTFNGVTYNGVYRSDLKSQDNQNLTIDQLGTNENPYVILEISPSSAISQIRAHIGDQGLFDLSNEDVAKIELSDTDKITIRLNTLKYFCDKKLAELEEEYPSLSATIASLTSRRDAIISQIKEQKKNEYWNSIKTQYSIEADWQVYSKIQELNPGVNGYGDANHYYENIPEVRQLVDDAIAESVELQQIISELEKLSVPDVKNAVNNRGNRDISDVLTELENTLFDSGVITEEKYEQYLQGRFDYALQYKITCRKSEIYDSTIRKGYGFNYNYVTQYAVSDGKFVINTPENTENVGNTSVSEGTFSKDGTLKNRLDLSSGGDANAIYGEYALTTKISNPLAVTPLALGGIGSGIGLYTADYAFAKSCLDLGYNTTIESGIIVSQSPHIDEYIFAGWYIKVDGNLERIETTLTDEFKEKYPSFSLAEVTDLYTNWSVRRYETDTYMQLLTSPVDGENVEISFGGSNAYTIHLPGEIASANSGEQHDPRNQLTMCTPDSMQALVTWSTAFTDYYETSVDFVQEVSAWDFSFSKADYNTVEKLQQVAPKLMSDTDYYVRTFNTEVAPDGKVHYYPYNVKVVTLSPEDLNRMVYYDYALKGRSSWDDGYFESDYLNTFLNNVDFIILFNGGSSLYLNGTNDVFTLHDLNYQKSLGSNALEPNQLRVPSLYTYDSTKKEFVYDKSAIKTNASFTSTADVSDLEWQVVYKMYTRLLDSTQKRRLAIITDESITDQVAGRAGAACAVKKTSADSGGGSQDNLCKFIQLLYAYTDPTLLYDFYANPEYTEHTFDKMRGSKRSEEYRNTYFTGVLYECEFWNTALFFPYEFLGENHYDAATNNDIFNKYSPFTAGTGGDELYKNLGISSYPNYKNIANPYAYTFNGDTHLSTDLYKYDIKEYSNVTNQQPNTKLAFDYFRLIPGRDSEIKDGMLATKSAIEFMVQNVRNGVINYKDRKITILNKINPQKKFKITGGTLLVDRVVADDYSATTADIEYYFTGSTSGYFVVEYFWTNQYSQLDEDNRLGKSWRGIYTNKKDDDNLKWYTVPDSCQNLTGERAESFVTKKIVYTAVPEGAENTEDPGHVYDANHDTTNPNHILKWYNNDDGNNAYAVNALIKPTVKSSADEPTYIISVMQFEDAEAYRSYLAGDKDKLLTVTLKNVTIDKMKYLFNLD